MSGVFFFFFALRLLLILEFCLLQDKEDLRKNFAKLANDFEQKLHNISSELAGINGPLEVRFSSYYQFLLT